MSDLFVASALSNVCLTPMEVVTPDYRPPSLEEVTSVIPSVDNVLGIYANASANSLREGLSWYLDAHNFCKTLDPQNVERAAGIVAALSPMNGWENNKNKAAQLYRQNGDGTGCGLKANVSKAVRIYNGEDPREVLRGDKVRAFFETIANPTSQTVPPVIDRHAFDIAVGEKTDDKTRGMLGRKGVYGQFAEVYCEAAKIAGIGSAQMQAVTWVAWREIHGIA